MCASHTCFWVGKPGFQVSSVLPTSPAGKSSYKVPPKSKSFAVAEGSPLSGAGSMRIFVCLIRHISRTHAIPPFSMHPAGRPSFLAFILALLQLFLCGCGSNPALVTILSYTDSTVSTGNTYYYVSTAADSAGEESSYSDQVTAVIPQQRPMGVSKTGYIGTRFRLPGEVCRSPHSLALKQMTPFMAADHLQSGADREAQTRDKRIPKRYAIHILAACPNDQFATGFVP